jgi:GT2 family glycosyltransferase
MGFVPYGQPAEVTLAVVAYGTTPRLHACLESLQRHASLAAFDVICVINPTERDQFPDVADIPEGMKTLLPEANLGWAGGLHLARRETTAPYMAWIQDDSEVIDGWLDAHLAAAADYPKAGAFGAVAVDDDGRATGFSGGSAHPADAPAEWNLTDPSKEGEVPARVEDRDWITSKGMLVRMAAWDDVGGPCARQYPLNHVDKEFSTHLRTHGWGLKVVPGARLKHLQSQSAPSLFRTFVEGWQGEAFAARWAEPVRAMAAQGGGPVDHDCHDHPDIAMVERECLREASRMLVPLGKYASREVSRANEATFLAHAEAEGLRASTSWRVTSPMRWVSGRFRPRKASD